MRLTKSIVLIAGLFIAAGMFGGCSNVPAGHEGVVVNNYGKNRGVESFPVKTGAVWFNPISTQIFSYPTCVQPVIWTASTQEGHAVDESVTFSTAEQIQINADISLSFQIMPTKTPYFYVTFRNDDVEGYIHGYLRNLARISLNKVAGGYNLEDLNGPKKAEFIALVDTMINNNVKAYGQVTNFGFTGALRMDTGIVNSIHRKMIAKQDAEASVNLLAKTEADGNRLIVQKTKEAQANNVVNTSISPQLLELKRLEITEKLAERWNGQQPYYISGSSNNLLMQLPAPK